MIRITTSLIALAAVAACGTPNPPTISTAQVGRSFEEARAISGLPFTSTQDLPTGSVTYIGKLGADVSGDLDGSILSDMRMNVGFSTNDISGSLTNINLIDPDGRPNQLFDGRLIIDGAQSGGQINAFASGDITGVNDNGFPMDSKLLLQLQGNVVDDIDRGDAVFGSVKGDGIGDLDFDIDGVFFGTAN
jgi:hypothetical protein